MDDPHVGKDLLAYLSGNLDGFTSNKIRDHLRTCDPCRREFASLEQTWNVLGHSPEELPAEGLTRRFQEMLRDYAQESRLSSHAILRKQENGFWNRVLPGQPAFRIAAAVIVLAVGVLSGYIIRGSGTSTPELTQLQGEVRGLSRLLTVSLLQQQSASERLKGVNWSSRLAASDPEILKALVNALKYDPNVNVRLAALDALSRDMSRPDVKSEIIRALPEQKSPLIQIALVDLLLRMDDKESRVVLQNVMNKPNLNQDVRKRIQQGIENVM